MRLLFPSLSVPDPSSTRVATPLPWGALEGVLNPPHLAQWLARPPGPPSPFHFIRKDIAQQLVGSADIVGGGIRQPLLLSIFAVLSIELCMVNSPAIEQRVSRNTADSYFIRSHAQLSPARATATSNSSLTNGVVGGFGET